VFGFDRHHHRPVHYLERQLGHRLEGGRKHLRQRQNHQQQERVVLGLDQTGQELLRPHLRDQGEELGVQPSDRTQPQHQQKQHQPHSNHVGENEDHQFNYEMIRGKDDEEMRGVEIF